MTRNRKNESKDALNIHRVGSLTLPAGRGTDDLLAMT